MANEAVSGVEPAEPRPAHAIKKATAVVTATGGLIAAVWGVVAIFYHGGADPTPVSQTATVAVGEPQTAGSHAVFDVDVGVTGRKGEPLRVTWTLWDRDTGAPVAENGFSDQTIAVFTPSSDELVQRSFGASVPAPSKGNVVFLRVEVFDSAGERLRLDDSPALVLGGHNTG